MALVKLGFTDLTIPQKILQTRYVVIKMTANDNFAVADPALSEITTAVDKLEAAFEDAKNGGKEKTAFVHVQEKVLDGLMSRLSSYIHHTSGGDETKILSSGMQTRALATPPQAVNAPEGLVAIPGKNEGEVLLSWKNVSNAKAYLIEQSADATSAWVDAGACTKSKINITGLVSGSKTWFKVCAIGAKGKGPWSDPARGMAG